jgi:hypothetical protein
MVKNFYLFFMVIISFYFSIFIIPAQTKQSNDFQQPVKNQNPETADTLKSELAHPWLQKRITFAEIDTIYGNAPAEDNFFYFDKGKGE